MPQLQYPPGIQPRVKVPSGGLLLSPEVSSCNPLGHIPFYADFPAVSLLGNSSPDSTLWRICPPPFILTRPSNDFLLWPYIIAPFHTAPTPLHVVPSLASLASL